LIASQEFENEKAMLYSKDILRVAGGGHNICGLGEGVGVDVAA
jgi:hypothetical protein